VSDGTGDDPFRVSSGADGIGCAAGPINRTVGSSSISHRGRAFPNRETAKAWMATEQYAQLKALMMSLTYS
jgi:hypothetical protein